MRASQWILRGLLGSSLLWLGACAAGTHSGNAPIMPETSITLERSTCFGNCAAYSVTAAADGTVTFVGHAHVQTMRADGHATPEQLAAIHDALVQADFAAMRGNYASGDDGCEMMMSDQPGIKITVNDASGSRTVNFYLGCTGPTADAVLPRITQLAQQIDQQLGTQRWIGTPSRPGEVEQADR